MRASRMRTYLLTAILATGPAMTLAPRVATAECIGGWTPMPSFTAVAPTAERIIVGTVLDEIGRDPGTSPGVIESFILDVELVLRGDDRTGPMEIDWLRTGARRTGKCDGIPLVFVRVGDRVALAIGGILPETGRRGSAAAWIEGRPDALAAPEGEVLTLARIRRIAATLPDTATAGLHVAGSTAAGALAVATGVPLIGRWLRAPGWTP